MKLKESDVKSDMERIWADWQDKHDALEEELKEIQNRANQVEGERKRLSKELNECKKDNRNLQNKIRDREGDIRVLQEKYEDMLSRLESENKEAISKNKEIQDAMQYEIEFFKKEVARLGSNPNLIKVDNFFSQGGAKPPDDGEKDPNMLEKIINVDMVTPIQHQKRSGASSSDERLD